MEGKNKIEMNPYIKQTKKWIEISEQNEISEQERKSCYRESMQAKSKNGLNESKSKWNSLKLSYELEKISSHVIGCVYMCVYICVCVCVCVG